MQSLKTFGKIKVQLPIAEENMFQNFLRPNCNSRSLLFQDSGHRRGYLRQVEQVSVRQQPRSPHRRTSDPSARRLPVKRRDARSIAADLVAERASGLSAGQHHRIEVRQLSCGVRQGQAIIRTGDKHTFKFQLLNRSIGRRLLLHQCVTTVKFGNVVHLDNFILCNCKLQNFISISNKK